MPGPEVPLKKDATMSSMARIFADYPPVEIGSGRIREQMWGFLTDGDPEGG
jgi:hypothetical protein